MLSFRFHNWPIVFSCTNVSSLTCVLHAVFFSILSQTIFSTEYKNVFSLTFCRLLPFRCKQPSGAQLNWKWREVLLHGRHSPRGGDVNILNEFPFFQFRIQQILKYWVKWKKLIVIFYVRVGVVIIHHGRHNAWLRHCPSAFWSAT